MTTEISRDEVTFANTSPAYPFDKVFKCFQHDDPNRQLYRLVDTEKKRWYFLNDSNDEIMKIKAEFKPGSKVAPLRGARMSSAEDANREVVYTIEAEVEPCFTIQFMEGEPNGFEVTFQMEAAPALNVNFINGRPRQRYDKIYPCFRNNGNGLLFRLVDDSTSTWYFHNDTTEFSMTAEVEFTDKNAVKPLGKTEETGVPEESPEGVVYRITVQPGETEPFISGTPSNYRMHYDAEPLKNEQPVAQPEYVNATPDRAVVGREALVYPCFREKENGLLFRIVDTKKGMWAYFNDTEEYIMRASVRFPKTEQITPTAECTVTVEGEEEDTVVTLDIPPLSTRKFIDGLPEVFTPSYTGEPVNKIQAEEHPNFLNGEPDRSLIDYHTVHRCIKAPDSDTVILYRLTDVDRHRWGFYNDTTDVTVVARVKFNPDAKIRRLGQTRVETDPEDGNAVCYVVDVAPQCTELFIEGEYESFEQKFTGTRKHSQRINE